MPRPYLTESGFICQKSDNLSENQQTKIIIKSERFACNLYKGAADIHEMEE